MNRYHARRSGIAAALLLLLGACASDEPESAPPVSPEAGLPPLARQEGDNLAHEHDISIETEKTALPEAFRTVADACTASEAFSCTVLHSELITGELRTGTLRLRVEPTGVDPIYRKAASLGTVERVSTTVEDLAKPIADTQARIAMLESQRDRLRELEATAAGDVDALIRIAGELARIQSELERLAGEAAHQRLRVETDIMNIRFRATRIVSFWGPIDDAFGSFSQEMSYGISSAITGFTRILPWFVVLLPFLLLLRWIWRRTRAR